MRYYKSDKQKREQQAGAVFAELAISLPVMLAIVFFVYWAFLAIGWRDAISVAVYNAVDLALGRGDPVLIGVATPGEVTGGTATGIIAGIDQYVNGTAFSAAPYLGSTNTAGVLNSGHSGIDPESEYTASIARQGWTGGQTLDQFPRQAIYAIAFAYDMLKDALPGDVRYPCNPTGTAPHEGAGCLLCTVGTPSQTLAESTGVVPSDRFAIECQFRPSGALIGALTGLLGLSPAQQAFVISHSRNSLVEDSEFLLNP